MVSLSKNQAVSLKKQSPTLNRLHFGLGWDPAKSLKSVTPITTVNKSFFTKLFGTKNNNDNNDTYDVIDIDLDASCVMIDVMGNVLDSVWFDNLESECGSVIHTGDNLTGEGEGDDEVILVELARLPFNVEYLVFTVNSYWGQTFNEVDNAFCRVLDQNNQELARYQLTEQGPHTGIIIATLKRNGGSWDFIAQGYPCTGETVEDMYSEIIKKVVIQ
ncbi:tellurium resistance TerZ family protein [Frischella sp. Ac48]|uniref:TerD family protein n=1 Tax=Frischella sp. Ac48 TaxID=2804531 RepID=UPI001C7D3815|nr:TerD family protein [Frischella sp. Ac48]MBX4132954.1 tellurium resistance TerZ family protein [Frischella sp. Ac48]